MGSHPSIAPIPESLPRRSPSRMASFNPQDFGFDDPPPRPTTPPVRRGFLVVLFILCLAALVVYGVPFVVYRVSYAWEAGRARADSEALAKLDKGEIVSRASLLFRMATNAVSPAVVNVQSYRLRKGGDWLCRFASRRQPVGTWIGGGRARLGGHHRQESRVHRHQQSRRPRTPTGSPYSSVPATMCPLSSSAPTPSQTSPC